MVQLATERADAAAIKAKLWELAGNLKNFEEFVCGYTDLPMVVQENEDGLQGNNLLSAALVTTSEARRRVLEVRSAIIEDRTPQKHVRLTKMFITDMRILWFIITGQEPARSREGPFVNFVSAAWLAAEFPLPRDRYNPRKRRVGAYFCSHHRAGK